VIPAILSIGLLFQSFEPSHFQFPPADHLTAAFMTDDKGDLAMSLSRKGVLTVYRGRYVAGRKVVKVVVK